MVYVDGGRVRALTRNDKSLTSTFPELRDIGLHLGSRSAILDGEIVALDKRQPPELRDARAPTARHVEDRHREARTHDAGELLRLRPPLPRGSLAHRARPTTNDAQLLESLELQARRSPRRRRSRTRAGKDVLAHRPRARTRGRRHQAARAPYSPGLRNGTG